MSVNTTSAPAPTFATWRDAYEAIRERLTPFVKPLADGTFALDSRSTPGPLAERYGRLTELGLEYGWLAIDDSTATIKEVRA